VNVKYAIGVGNDGQEILVWKSLTTPAASQTITETFTTALAEDFGFVISVELEDKITFAKTYYYSAAIKVGNRIASDLACASIWNPVGSEVQTPPRPIAVIAYDTAAQVFNFEVTADYLLQGYTWVIDFAPFTEDITKGYKGLAATNCENRQIADFTDPTPDRHFSELWNAAPAANYAGGLNSGNFLSYRHGSNTPLWSVAAQNCSTIKYTAASLSFSKVSNCKKADGVTPSVIRQVVDGKIHYNGTLYVSAVKAINQLDASEGFVKYEYTFPFFVSFAMTITTITTADTSDIFSFTVTDLTLSSDGNLDMTLVTNTFSVTHYLTTPTFSTVPAGVVLSTASTPANSQFQIWRFVSTTPVTDYSGSYTITFTRTDGTNSESVPASFVIRLKANDLYSNNGVVLPVNVGFYSSTLFDTTKALFKSTDTIYVKSAVATQNLDDVNTYDNAIYNVWLCYTINDIAPVWNPDSNEFGCQQQTWNIRTVARLVDNGVAVTSGDLESQFVTSIIDPIVGFPSVHTGVSFKADPLASIRQGKFFLHVESIITLPSKKRSVHQISGIGAKVEEFEITMDVVTSTIPSVNSSSTTSLASLLASLMIGLIPTLLCC
jgi:hypothetical protein